ncbi:MAG: hypothetical protein WCA54_12410 [Pseudolabrys sp.]
MRIKSVTLYSVPYAVAIASIFVGAQQFAPPVTLIVPWDTAKNHESYSAQTVNRALKGDQLPMTRSTPETVEKVRTKSPARSITREIVVSPATA